MPAPENQVRVFISSTFRGMHAERDHVVTVVFPELRERVEQLGLEFPVRSPAFTRLGVGRTFVLRTA